MEAEVQIMFPSPIKNYSTDPVNSQYRIWDVNTGIYFIAGAENYTPVNLTVTEGDRSHHFILAFKKVITNNEAKLYYDFSTVKKLARHINQQPFQKSTGMEKTAVNAASIQKEKKNEKLMSAEASADSSLNLYALYKPVNKDSKATRPQQANQGNNNTESLSKEKIAVQKPKGQNPKLSKNEKIAQKENEKKYVDVIVEARFAMEQKNYLPAQIAYKKALELKPGDFFAAHQLQKISNLLPQVNTQNEKRENSSVNVESFAAGEKLTQPLMGEESYETAVKLADNFFKEEDYDSAKIYYAKALGFSKKEWPAIQMSKIDKILSELAIRENADKKKLADLPKVSPANRKRDSIVLAAELKKKYNLAIAKAKSSYNKQDFLNAKIFYEEAMNLQPQQQEPKNQLKIIDKKLEEIARETEINNNYERVILLADSQSIAKAYEPAMATYREASTIKPLESYPWKQIKYIKSALAAIEKRKNEQVEQRYKEVLTRADKAVTDKHYDEAKTAYTEALGIHGDNEYAKRRLEIISYQLEKERLEKFRLDSLKAIPVKKSRRKRSS